MYDKMELILMKNCDDDGVSEKSGLKYYFRVQIDGVSTLIVRIRS